MSRLGVALIVLGVALAVAEAHAPSQARSAGARRRGATGSSVVAGAGVSLAVALAAGLAPGRRAGLLWIVLRKALLARRRRVRSGTEGLVGRVGEVRAAPARRSGVPGRRAVARPAVGCRRGRVLERGDPIVVERVDGLTLTVRRAEDWEVAP